MDPDYTDHKTSDTDALKRDFSKLRESLESVKDKLGDNAHEILDRISAQLETSKLSSRLGSIEEELAHLGSKLKESGFDAAAKLEDRVTDKPLASIAVAFGIGLLAAGILRRSR